MLSLEGKSLLISWLPNSKTKAKKKKKKKKDLNCEDGEKYHSESRAPPYRIRRLWEELAYLLDKLFGVGSRKLVLTSDCDGLFEHDLLLSFTTSRDSA